MRVAVKTATPVNITPSISKHAQGRFDKASTKPPALGKTVEKSAVKLVPVVKKDKFRAFKNHFPPLVIQV